MPIGQRVRIVALAVAVAACGASAIANATAAVSYSQIGGGAPPERDALIFWWTPQGTAAVGFDTVLVRIR